MINLVRVKRMNVDCDELAGCVDGDGDEGDESVNGEGKRLKM